MYEQQTFARASLCCSLTICLTSLPTFQLAVQLAMLVAASYRSATEPSAGCVGGPALGRTRERFRGGGKVMSPSTSSAQLALRGTTRSARNAHANAATKRADDPAADADKMTCTTFFPASSWCNVRQCKRPFAHG